jgi:hypothetical protein
MTNEIKLEVGQWVELNNGDRHEVFQELLTKCWTINGKAYYRNGRYMVLQDNHPLSVARILPHMTLPNGDVLFEGDWAKRRDGKVVEIRKHDGGPEEDAPWFVGAAWYHSNGNINIKNREYDLIAKADPPQVEDKPQIVGRYIVENGKWFELVPVAEPEETKRETVVLYGADVGYGWEFDEVPGGDLTRITFDLINGKMPTGTFTNEDGETIVVEEVAE